MTHPIADHQKLSTDLTDLQEAKMAAEWAACRFLTCSVLPVRMACNLRCPFCFSRSSISALQHDRLDWRAVDIDRYFAFARERGATRLVVTGGGEPLLRPADVVHLIARGARFFDEIACFTNGSRLNREWAQRMRDAGLSYLCFSRHHHLDATNRELMGLDAPTLDAFFAAVEGLSVRATCVMCRGFVDSADAAWQYIRGLAPYGVREFTLKHTYVAYRESVFADSPQNRWAQMHRVTVDPFASSAGASDATVIGALPWGPRIRRIAGFQVCYYFEPTPEWERENRLCRSSNLLSDGAVYASLEDQRSLLFRLT